MQKSSYYGRNMTRYSTTQSEKINSKLKRMGQTSLTSSGTKFSRKPISTKTLTNSSTKAQTGRNKLTTTTMSSISSIKSGKRVFVKFIFEGKQRKRILQESELSLKTLLKTASEMVKTQNPSKTQKSKKSEKIEIYLDQEFTSKLDQNSFEEMLKKCEKNGKLVLQKFYIKKVVQTEKTREEAEKKVLEAFDLLMRQDIVKKFINKKKGLMKARSDNVNRRSDIGGRVYEEDVVSSLMQCLLTIED